jgi:hypothetical protein
MDGWVDIHNENGVAVDYGNTNNGLRTINVAPGIHSITVKSHRWKGPIIGQRVVEVPPGEFITVIFGPADLVISSSDIIFSNETLPEGETVNISATIRNEGDADTPGFTGSFYDNATLIGSVVTGPITAGGTVEMKIPWIATPAGTHEIHVFVDTGDAVYEISEDNNHAWAEVNVTVSNVPPVAVASADSTRDYISNYPVKSYAGDVISFSSAGSYDPDGEIVTYLWDFGDGETSNEENPEHVYDEPNVYSIKLTVNDDKGASNYSYKHMFIEARCPPPTDVGLTIKNAYDRKAVLKMFQAILLDYLPVQYQYIDVDVNATVLDGFNFDICIFA